MSKFSLCRVVAEVNRWDITERYITAAVTLTVVQMLSRDVSSALSSCIHQSPWYENAKPFPYHMHYLYLPHQAIHSRDTLWFNLKQFK